MHDCHLVTQLSEWTREGWNEVQWYSSSLTDIKPWLFTQCHTQSKASADLISQFTDTANTFRTERLGAQSWRGEQSGFRHAHSVLAWAPNHSCSVLPSASRHHQQSVYFTWHRRNSKRLWSLSNTTLKSGKTSWAWWYSLQSHIREAEAGGFQSSWLLLSLLFFF